MLNFQTLLNAKKEKNQGYFDEVLLQLIGQPTHT